jgi:hypothetical protein
MPGSADNGLFPPFRSGCCKESLGNKELRSAQQEWPDASPEVGVRDTILAMKDHLRVCFIMS